MTKIIPVILSGGSGTRLWPMSTPERPKQMLPLVGPESMLAATAARVGDPAIFAPPMVVASQAHADAIEAEVPGLGTLILEPAARNTAPAIALAALAAGQDDLLLVLPSDHLIRDEAAFSAAVEAAAPAARDGWLVTFGIHVERPETGYGYILRGGEIAPGVHEVEKFVEKPDVDTARLYQADGRYDWNGGIFLLRAGTFMDALRSHAPEMASAVEAAVAGARREGRRLYPDAARFRATPSQSIDYAVMEKAARIAVVPVAMGWSDVGSWDVLWEVAEKDMAANAVGGDVIALGSSDCLIRSDGPTVAAIGVSDLIIVATRGAVLVVPRGESQRVREAVDALKAREHGTTPHS
jgi:mannose-1-phosphate guanylyltransferase/mannose-1-phosphate guanylyltransferase/mannose-6-phosphate isomerase